MTQNSAEFNIRIIKLQKLDSTQLSA